jgi:ADP-dependent NAD(P)H-hydrate dehydratase / NAD(P)H-hydrate epimerase
MKILTAEQIRAIDAYTIENEPIPSLDLMERAATACFNWIHKHMRNKTLMHVFCGLGNNGGDGLAIARMLAGRSHRVRVYIIRYEGKMSDDFMANEKRLAGRKNLHIQHLFPGDLLPDISDDDLVIDAMFGSGLTRPLTGYIADVVTHINASMAAKVSIDMPSGLFSDLTMENDTNAIVRADHTLTFQFPKLAFMFAQYNMFVGRWHVLDIGLHPEAIEKANTNRFLIDPADLKPWLKVRNTFAHKGHFGHALLIAGSRGKMGAAVLAAKACLRSGVGLLTSCVPACGVDIMQTSVPEAMAVSGRGEFLTDELPKLDKYNTVAIGPGLGTHTDTARVLKSLIQQAGFPLVLDADAINILAENKTWCDFLPKYTIITPHPGEFDRLAGKSYSDVERFNKALNFSARFQLIIVLKGAYTAIIAPDGNCWFNTTGNPGMASGGSGDVLTGHILGLLASGYSPLQSALLGVYLHGSAGDLACSKRGNEGLIAGDIADMIPKAFMRLQMA